jgi:hypothetical protein
MMAPFGRHVQYLGSPLLKYPDHSA